MTFFTFQDMSGALPSQSHCNKSDCPFLRRERQRTRLYREPLKYKTTYDISDLKKNRRKRSRSRDNKVNKVYNIDDLDDVDDVIEAVESVDLDEVDQLDKEIEKYNANCIFTPISEPLQQQLAIVKLQRPVVYRPFEFPRCSQNCDSTAEIAKKIQNMDIGSGIFSRRKNFGENVLDNNFNKYPLIEQGFFL